MRICILHLDLGQGGAERQTVDEALALKSLGHDVTLITSHHDPKRCFEETIDPSKAKRNQIKPKKNSAKLGDKIEVYGNWIPMDLFGRCHLLMSIFRMLWCILRMIWKRRKYDVIFVDQVPHIIPFLRGLYVNGINPDCKIIFYCHFPDLLLVPNRAKMGRWKKIYRSLFDWTEQITTACCDQLL
ncbi:alpha-1,2-mannosyltransferase (Alg2), partial [Reticulomyxa filosa]